MIVKNLFKEEKIKEIWNDNLLHFTANLLAASTGLRLGEIRGLRAEDIQDDWVSVTRSYGKFGPGPTKTKRTREVPIPSRVNEYLDKVMPASGYVFSVNDGDSPVHGNRIEDFFIKALENAGISDAERRERNISFHGWRHFFNTACRRNGIPDPLIRSWTGHSTIEMTEHYSRFGRGDYKGIVDI